MQARVFRCCLFVYFVQNAHTTTRAVGCDNGLHQHMFARYASSSHQAMNTDNVYFSAHEAIICQQCDNINLMHVHFRVDWCSKVVL